MVQTLTERLFNDSEDSLLDPFAIFEEWFELAVSREPNDPHAMAVASVDTEGMPDVRMVLMNHRDVHGYCFFTNLESAKGLQLLAHPKAAYLFHWKSLRRQIRMRGDIVKVADAEADAYFASRAKGSRIASATSKQSQPLANRAQMMGEVAKLTAMVGDGDIARPGHWSGFRLVPTQIEFWKDGEFRLHDRVRFTRPNAGAAWSRTRLYP